MLIAPKKVSAAPTLDEYIDRRGIQDWDEAQCLEWYLEDYPEQAVSARRNRLLSRQMELIRTLETAAASPPDAEDRVECWYDDLTAQRLRIAGIRTLGDLLHAAHASVTWYAQAPSIGEEKAARIAAQARRLLPNFQHRIAATASTAFQPPCPANEALIDAWISSGISESTAKKYKREAVRLALWIEAERGAGTVLSSLRPEDCAAYESFLAHIPVNWLSESQARRVPFSPGWAPFREPLTETRRAECIAALTTFFGWLWQTQAVAANPWARHLTTPAPVAGRPRGGANPFQSRMELLRAKIWLPTATPSLERSVLGLIWGLLDTAEVSAQALTKLKIKDFIPNDSASALRVGKKLVLLPPATANLLGDVLTWRAISVASAEDAMLPLLCNPRFPDRPLSYRTLLTLIDKWAPQGSAARADFHA